MTNVHIGSSFDDFLREEGIHKEASASAAIRVLGWQLWQQIEEQGISKVELARRMGTSRSQADRLLQEEEMEQTSDDPPNSKHDPQQA